MTALPRRMYRDPAEQLLEAEAATCKGCRFRLVSSQLSVHNLLPMIGCTNPRMINRRVFADVRCDEYEEKL